MNHRHSTAETPEQIIEHISRLMAEAEAMLAGPVSEKNHINHKLEDLKHRVASARDKVGAIYSTARRQVIAGAKYTDNTIREYPYYSLAIAAGVGVLLGALLRRDGRD